MEIPRHDILHASFIVRISAERSQNESANTVDGWAIHGWVVLAHTGESWRFTDLHDLPVILAGWLATNPPTQHQHQGDQ